MVRSNRAFAFDPRLTPSPCISVILGTGVRSVVSNPHVEGVRRSGSGMHDMSDLAQSLPWSQSEDELVTELQAGSDAAFDYLVTYYHASVYNLVCGILGDPSEAADVTQDVFLRVFRGIRGFRRSSSLKTWLYRVSVRQALNHRRWCWRHHRQQVSIESEEENRGPAFELRGTEATPFELCATHEMQAAVRRALLGVPAFFRSAVILRDLEGLSYEEIAEVLEISVGTVKSRILRGRRMLKEMLGPLLHAPQAEISRAREPLSREDVLRRSPAGANALSPVRPGAMAGNYGASQ